MGTAWPHAPPHHLGEAGAYMVTAATYQKAPIFNSSTALDGLQAGLLQYARKHGWNIEAWAVFPNHYHFVAQSPESDASGLSAFLTELHSRSARWINAEDQVSGRKVWHNFWDTHLTYERSYLARLNYVHQNAVKHGLVKVASDYCWCSARWFEQVANPAMVKVIYSLKTDRISVVDDF